MKRLYVDGLIASGEDKDVLDAWGYPNVTPEDVRLFLNDAAGEDVEIWVNSYGGDVWAAMAIYAQLKDYKGASKALITGLSASAATIVMCGCDTVEASIGAQIMMHNASASAEGDYHDMYVSAEQLQTANNSILAIYTAKTGRKVTDLKQMMERTTWMDAQMALEAGFVDNIVDFSDQRLVAALQDRLPRSPEGEVLNTYHKTIKALKESAVAEILQRKQMLELEKERFNVEKDF